MDARALFEPGCADIDVAGAARRLSAAVPAARRQRPRPARGWIGATVAAVDGSSTLADGSTLTRAILVNAAGAWADGSPQRCGVAPLGIAPKRRTMVQLRVGRSGLATCRWSTTPTGTFYFKGEGDRSVWLSPHDEIATEPCDAAPEEIDVATAIDRFERWSTGRSSGSSAAGRA